MADLCYDCTKKLGVDPDLNDLDRTGRGNYQYMDLCEGCGWGYFDEKGKKIRDLESVEGIERRPCTYNPELGECEGSCRYCERMESAHG